GRMQRTGEVMFAPATVSAPMTTASSLAERTAPRCVRAVTMTSPPATPIRPSSRFIGHGRLPGAHAGALVESRSTSGFCNRTDPSRMTVKIRVHHGGKHPIMQFLHRFQAQKVRCLGL